MMRGFNGLVPKIKAADLIVFASPLYFWTVSSRIKATIACSEKLLGEYPDIAKWNT